MTPHQFARAECANMRPDGSCLGIKPEDLFDFGQIKLASPKPHCLLRHPGKRCRYFKEVVLPIADQPSPKADPTLQQRRLKAREAYWAQVGVRRPAAGKRVSRGHKPRSCPDCNGLLAKRQRICRDCAGRRRRESARRCRRKP